MKYLTIVFVFMSTCLFAKEYKISKKSTTSYENVETVVKKLHENPNIINIKFEQIGSSEWFDIYWVECVVINH